MRTPLLLALLLFLPAPALAQTVRGSFVLEPGGGVGGALATLAADEGRVVARALTGPDGRFALIAPAPGRYTLRVERVGHRTVAREVELAGGEAVELRLATAVEPFVLPAIEVSVEERCTVRPGQGMAAYALWEQARRALEATAYQEEEERVEYTVRSWWRVVEVTRGRTRRGNDPARRVTGRPFHTLSPEELAAGGYVREEGDSISFYGPDARTLLSDPFLDAHCLYVDGASPDGRSVALAFRPARDGAGVGLEGVVWLDLRTGELRSVEYRYALPEGTRGGPTAGGTVEFRRLPEGPWIVSAWRIRMTDAVVETPPASRTRRGGVPAAIREAGGEVTGAVPRP